MSNRGIYHIAFGWNVDHVILDVQQFGGRMYFALYENDGKTKLTGELCLKPLGDPCQIGIERDDKDAN